MRARIDRHVAFAACWLALLPACGGCRNCDAVEAELRIRELQTKELHAKLRQAELNNMVLQRELYEQRTIVGPPPGPNSWRLPPEVSGSTSRVQRITLGRLTGGHANAYDGGDDSLQVVVEPRDTGDRVFKATGTLRVEAHESTTEGGGRLIGSWDLSAEQLAAKWRGGLFGSAYEVILPWQQGPTMEQVRIVVRFTADGRTFEAMREMKVRLAPRPNAPAGRPPEIQGPILSRVFSFWKKDRRTSSPRREEGIPVPVVPLEVQPVSAHTPTWQPTEGLPPVTTRLLSPIPEPETR
jgi:hypothetical protein